VTDSFQAIFGPGGLIARRHPSYEYRPGQIEMAAAVASTFERGGVAVVEAGTGTGKTLAYLIPAVATGRRLVISTATKSLQEQILKKDIPLLQQTIPLAFQATVLKGITNYLCLRRFAEHDRQLAMLGTDDPALARLRAWAATTDSGDRAELTDLADDAPIWRDVCSTSETRLGARCPHFEACFVTKARRRAQAADLVIVNHHLFFADLALRRAWPQAQLLPTYEAVIFDEAHQIEDVATDYFSTTVSTLRVLALVRDLRKAVGAAHLDARLEGTAHHVEHLGDVLFGGLRERLPRDGRG